MYVTWTYLDTKQNRDTVSLWNYRPILKCI